MITYTKKQARDRKRGLRDLGEWAKKLKPVSFPKNIEEWKGVSEVNKAKMIVSEILKK